MKTSTSEEKLLKLIRKKDNSQIYDNKLANGKNNVQDKKDGDVKKARHNINFLKICNRLLVAGAVVISCYIAFRYFIFNKNEILLAQESIEITKSIEGNDVNLFEEKKPFSYYKETIASRNIFQAPWEKLKEDIGDIVEEVPSIKKKLKLVGVLLDNNPMAIVEDLKTKQTLFVFKGDKVGGALLEEIHEGKVIFLYENERVEIVQ